LGIKELAEAETLPKNRNRKAGGGRKLALEKEPDLNDVSDGYTILASALQFLLSKVLSWVDFK
jgi:hypothetical protein